LGNKKDKQLIVLIVLLIFTCLMVYGLSSSKKPGKKITLSPYLEKIEGYTTERDSALPAEVYQALDLDDYMSTAYTNTAGRVSLYIGYYYSIDKVSAAHSPTVCFPSQGWTIDQPVMKSLVVGDKTIHYAEIVASILENKSLILYWYQAYHSTSPYIYKNKLNTLFNKLSGKSEEHAFVRISVPFSQMTKESAEKTGTDFIRAFYLKFIKFMDEEGKEEDRRQKTEGRRKG
jgi:EpsI family protein